MVGDFVHSMRRTSGTTFRTTGAEEGEAGVGRNRKDGEADVNPVTKLVCQHRKPPWLRYNNWHADTERRAKAGEKQKWCVACRKYIWESFWNRTA